MTELIVLMTLFIGLIICFADWRKGIFLCMLVGFLQDPLRKLMPEEPVYMSAMVAFFVVATLLGAKFRIGRIGFQMIHRMKGYMRTPLALFILLVIAQSIIAFITTQSPAIAGIGLIGYLSPLPTLLIGFYLVRSETEIYRIMRFYMLCNIVVASGIFLSFFGYDWTVLKAVGSELYVYPVSGGTIRLHPGFMRSSEVAAWHLGTAICVAIMFFVALKRSPIKWLAIPLVVFFGFALVLTGRRKIIVEIMLFLSFYGFLLLLFRRGAMKLALAVIVVGMSVSYFVSIYVLKDADSDFPKYFERPRGVGGAAVERLNQMTIESFRWIIARNGVLGSGAGTGSQGAQHFGGGISRVGGAAEGGFGKVLAELGVPGLAIFSWLLISLLRYLKWILDESKNRDFLQTQLIFSMIAFLLSNAFVFIAAHQVFGDIFVLFMLTLMMGFILGMQKIHMLVQEKSS